MVAWFLTLGEGKQGEGRKEARHWTASGRQAYDNLSTLISALLHGFPLSAPHRTPQGPLLTSPLKVTTTKMQE